MAETEQFEENKAKAEAIKNPLMLTLREHPKAVAQLIGFTLLSTLCYYTFFSAMTPFAVAGNGLDDGMVFWALSAATALFIALQYPFGWTADRFGRKPQMLVWSGAIALLMVPVSTLVNFDAGFGSMLLVFCFGLGLYPMLSSIAPAIMRRAVPDRAAWPGHRGLVQPHRRRVRRHRAAGDPVARRRRALTAWFFWYVSAGAAIAFVATLSLPETKGRCSSEPGDRPGRAGPGRHGRCPRGGLARRCAEILGEGRAGGPLVDFEDGQEQYVARAGGDAPAHVHRPPRRGAREPCGLGVDPFAAEVDGDRMVERGTSDMKSGVAALVEAVAAPPPPVTAAAASRWC